MEVDVKDLRSMYQRLARLEEMRVKHEEKLDTINSRLQVLENSKFNAHLTEEKLLQLESFAGVINRKVDDIESYRDYKERKREKQIHKIKMIIQAILIALSIFIIGFCCGVLQWK
jgi:hypothetical protein